MGKKGTKRKTRWRALPLGEDDGGSGNEEELLDEDQSTTSSVIGHVSAFKVHQPFFKQYRQPRRFLYDRFRSREPLVKLESKTFDEEEYTKITTPRQDVLFKKGYFGRKRECSAEETVPNAGEAEGEEPVMDQYIITNGFVDEQGHYYVNGSSYEVYDPYSNTVTVVVGPPPYTNGVIQPVLAAVSCQPVPLQPVEWYPPGSDWPSQGSAWTPSYSPNPHADPNMSASLTNCETDSAFNGHEGQGSDLHPQTAYVVPNYEYNETQVYNPNDVLVENAVEPTTEVLCSNDDELETELKRIRRKSGTLDGKEEKVEEKKPVATEEKEESHESKDPFPNAAKYTANSESMEVTITEQKTPEIAHETAEPKTSEKETIETKSLQHSDVRHVEKQSHSTQTNSIECENFVQKPVQFRVKESHSTQTMPEETLPVNEPPKIDLKVDKNQDIPSGVVLSSLLKYNQAGKSTGKSREIYRSAGRHAQEEPVKKFCQRRLNEEKRPKPESKPFEQVTISSFKISYAKKVLNGLEHSATKEGKIVNCVNSTNDVKAATVNGSSDSLHAQVAVANELLSSNFKNKTNYNNKRLNNDKLIVAENKRNNSARIMNSNVRNGYERHAKFGRNLISSKQPSKTISDPISVGNKESKNKDKKPPLRYEGKQVNLNSSVNAEDDVSKEKCNGEMQNNDCRTHSEKSSTISELSSPTELSSGQNTPPEKLIVRKMEQEITNDLSKSFGDKLKENLTKKDGNEAFKEKEGTDNATTEQTINAKVEDDSEKKEVGEVPTKDRPKASKSRKKKKKKAFGLKGDNPEDSMESLLFLQENGKSQDFLFKGWQGISSEQIAEMSDMDSILTAKKDEILETLEKWKLPRLPLASELSLFPGFGRECPKLTFENLFAPTTAKNIQYDLFTKTNITSMRSSRPEEFFATIVENPLKELTRSEKKEGGGRSGKKGVVVTEKRATAEAVKVPRCGNQFSLKKSASSSKPINKINKSALPCKTDGNSEKINSKTVKEDKKNEVMHEEAKLGIVDAVNTWLQEHGDSKKILSLDSLSESLEKIAEEKENEEPDQKNGLSNPIHALSVEDNGGSLIGTKEDGTCIRVANISKDDGFLTVDATNTEAKKNVTKLFRSSSWDAKLSEVQMKKHFKLLAEASSWDRRRKKTDVRLKKHFKFITNSASYCHDLIGDVRNGFELATEELCDPRQSVSKYYTLSPSILDSFDRSNEMECESEVFDALEYKFLGRHGIRSRDAGEGLSVADSGVHSDTESNEEGTSTAVSDVQLPLPGKQACCKMQ